ncbi:hypothetical protein [Brevibacterium yomogidense]|uniref:hypothetical protein n=1 Tax=Brevibacterium yomogidense TaxID=946573 RepID=UPI0018DF7D05|nr:hypothetical protein [Brevibacterium yomogidense]
MADLTDLRRELWHLREHGFPGSRKHLSQRSSSPEMSAPTLDNDTTTTHRAKSPAVGDTEARHPVRSAVGRREISVVALTPYSNRGDWHSICRTLMKRGIAETSRVGVALDEDPELFKGFAEISALTYWIDTTCAAPRDLVSIVHHGASIEQATTLPSRSAGLE